MGKHSMDQDTSRETQAWRNAYYIAWVGACNQVAVQSAYSTHAPHLGEDHPAVRAIKGQLEFLQGTSPGPSAEDIQLVLEHAASLGLIDGETGRYIG
jgi:hypothetical protein